MPATGNFFPLLPVCIGLEAADIAGPGARCAGATTRDHACARVVDHAAMADRIDGEKIRGRRHEFA